MAVAPVMREAAPLPDDHQALDRAPSIGVACRQEVHAGGQSLSASIEPHPFQRARSATCARRDPAASRVEQFEPHRPHPARPGDLDTVTHWIGRDLEREPSAQERRLSPSDERGRPADDPECEHGARELGPQPGRVIALVL